MKEKKNNLKRKICIVTGATSGIGLETARALAEQGSTVILVGRERRKTEAVVERIKQETANPSVEFLLADLSIQTQVRHLAEEFTSRYSRLDVLVNNVGAIFIKRQLSEDGIEKTLAVNYLNVFLLTNLLLETLKASAPSRIVNLSSSAHLKAKIKFDDLEGKHKYGVMRNYGQSKLAVVLFTYELARRMAGTNVAVTAAHPGFVATNFGGNNTRYFWLIWLVMKLYGISPVKGAETIIHLASSPEVEGVTGKYFYKKEQAPSNPVSHDEALASRLWQVSAEMTGLA